MPNVLIRFVLPATLLAAVAAAVLLPPANGRDKQPAAAQTTVGGPFSLVDHHGRAVTDADYRGRYLLVAFGFTFCPAICPTTLQTVAEALEALGPSAGQVQPLFVSIDPERDTPEAMAAYVAAFHPAIVGLTGTPQQVRQAADAYRIYFRKEGGGSDYLMDHTAILYLMGPDGRYRTYFPHDIPGKALADALRRQMSPAGT